MVHDLMGDDTQLCMLTLFPQQIMHLLRDKYREQMQREYNYLEIAD